MTALERAARAAYDCEHGLESAHYTGSDAHFENEKVWWMETARAVLMSVRDPSDGVARIVGRAAWHSGSGVRPQSICTAMIDAILNEGAAHGQA